MDTKKILENSIATVTFLFAAFGNFLLDIAPPGETNSRFATGISSILVLFLLLFISAATKTLDREKMKKIWLSASLIFFVATIISSGIYYSNLNKLTFIYSLDGKKYIAGTEWTDKAKLYREGKENHDKAPSEMLADYGGPTSIENVWTKPSIDHSKMILTANYVIIVLSAAIMLFSLTEGILVKVNDKDISETGSN